MSLEYYLLCRKKYEQILHDLTDIIEIYDSINEFTKLEEKNLDKEECDFFCPAVFRNHFIGQKNCVKYNKRICENKIAELCKHEFEEDIIDITPERSEKITYCKICEYTK